jgi:hypothetical protein
MSQFIVTVKYAIKPMFGKDNERFRVEANNEEQATELVKKHSQFPTDGKIIRVRQAAYKRK